MADDSSDQNPYSTLDSTRLSRRSLILPWLLTILSIVLFLVSILPAWHALELANQEYLHLWRIDKIIYDMEINGKPVSIDSAIRSSMVAVSILWMIAFGVALVARRISGNRINETGN